MHFIQSNFYCIQGTSLDAMKVLGIKPMILHPGNQTHDLGIKPMILHPGIKPIKLQPGNQTHDFAS